jgi:dihydrofolate reductase
MSRIDMPKVEIHGYAIVSDNDCIADALGRTPDVLRNEADWAYFQAELNKSAVTVLGRLGHEANPNPKGRLRVVLSSSSSGLERRSDGWWWNPAELSWDQAIRTVLPEGGRVAVPGGRQVFDLFLKIGYTAFHLTRAEGTLVPDGVPVFSGSRQGRSAEAILLESGLRPGRREVLDPAGPVTLTIWRSGSGNS